MDALQVCCSAVPGLAGFLLSHSGCSGQVRLDLFFSQPRVPQKTVGAAQACEGLRERELINSTARVLIWPCAASEWTHLVGSQHQAMAAAPRQGSVSTNHFCYFLH